LFLKKYYCPLSVLQTRSAPIGVELVVETTKNLIFQLNFGAILKNTVKFMIDLSKKAAETK
jgi:hypothetical protein